MTQLSTLKMPDGTPIFTCAFIGLVCSKCESFGLVLCPHLESRRSPWLDESRSTDMVNQLYGKNKALMLRETAAIDVGEDNCAFSEDMITKFKNNPLFSDELKNGEFKYVVTFCDPSGGRSQMALVSTIFCRQSIIVSEIFYLCNILFAITWRGVILNIFLYSTRHSTTKSKRKFLPSPFLVT